jgi:hypothetical protein
MRIEKRPRVPTISMPGKIPAMKSFSMLALNSRMARAALESGEVFRKGIWRRTAFDLRCSEARGRRFESVVLDKEEATHAKPCGRGKNNAIGLKRCDPIRVVVHPNQIQFHNSSLDVSERVSSLASHG